jgi:hypothetical protein
MDGNDRNPDDVKKLPEAFDHEEHVEIWELLGDIPG